MISNIVDQNSWKLLNIPPSSLYGNEIASHLTSEISWTKTNQPFDRIFGQKSESMIKLPAKMVLNVFLRFFSHWAETWSHQAFYRNLHTLVESREEASRSTINSTMRWWSMRISAVNNSSASRHIVYEAGKMIEAMMAAHAPIMSS